MSVCIAVLVCATAGGILVYVLGPMSRSNDKISLNVETGDTLSDVSHKLFSKNLIRHPFIAELLGSDVYKIHSIKPGEYTFTQSENIFAIMRTLIIGAPKRELRIVVPEGWTTREIALYLEKQGLFSEKEFENELQGDWGSLYPFLSGLKNQNNLEGYLFPDTYRVYADATPRAVLKKILDNFDGKFDATLRERARERGISMHDAITLASIVEREVSRDEDRALVADIFLRRLSIGMPLQADSTVNYITGKKSASPSIVDTKTESPYNTYRITGLPFGPICNPGLSAIRAVLYPKANDYLFFLTTSDGRTVFAKTFEEHVKNKKTYLHN